MAKKEENCSENAKKPLFRDLNPDDPDPEATEIESLCMNCGENGITKLLLTKIPFYKDVIIMSFSCEHCGFANNEIQSGGSIGERGVRITLDVRNLSDLNRRVVKSDYTCIKFPHIDFEIPSQSQKGEVTTVEGVINRAIAGLEQDQVIRRVEHPETAKQIDDFIVTLTNLKKLEEPFTMIIEDISGNSFLQNPNMPHHDPSCVVTSFMRSEEEDNTLGIYEAQAESSNVESLVPHVEKTSFTLGDLEAEVLRFGTNCPSCSSPCETNMKVTNIPYFKEVVIMASLCDTCGLRTNEVKSGGGIESQGIKIEVKVVGPEDFTRDILKSETCIVRVPELDLDVGSSTLGGKFTTIEGLLIAIRDQLSDHSIVFGDSEEPRSKKLMAKFMDKFDNVITGKIPITMILDDPAGNSYVQSFTPPEPDPGMTVIRYDRTFDQNEDLGLNDMKTENYEES